MDCEFKAIAGSSNQAHEITDVASDRTSEANYQREQVAFLKETLDEDDDYDDDEAEEVYLDDSQDHGLSLAPGWASASDDEEDSQRGFTPGTRGKILSPQKTSP